MIYILFVSAIILGVALRKSKIVTVYIFSVMYILAVFKSNVPDLGNYELEFLLASGGAPVDVMYAGYSWLLTSCAKTGMSFTMFLSIYYGICLAVFVVAIRRITSFPNVVMGLYLIHPFAIDMIQMKTAMANVWTLLGISFLLYHDNEKVKLKKKKDIFYFLLCSIIGCSFHYSVAVFVIIGLLYYFLEEKKFVRYIFGAGVFLVIFIYSNILPVIFSKILSFVPGNLKYMLRWLNRNVGLGFIFPAIAIVLIYMCAKLKIKVEGTKLEAKATFIQSVWCILPLFLYDVTFFRLLRVYLVLLYASVGVREKKKEKLGGMVMIRKMSKAKFVYICMLLILILYTAFYELNGAQIYPNLLKYNTLLTW